MLNRLIGAAAAGIVALATVTSAQAEFPEKDIKFLIPYGPGGGFDLTVRKIAPFVEKHLGGGVKVVPTNMPGGSGRKAATFLANSEPDGHTIMIFNIPGHGLSYIKGEEGGYDITDMTWLAQVGRAGYVVITAKDSPLRTLDDVKALDRPIKIPDQGPGSTSHMANQITWSTLGVEPQFISGYKSSREYSTAVLRGDGDLTMVAQGSAARYNKNGDFHIIAEFDDNQMFPDAPTGAEAGVPELHKLGLLRVVAGPPGMPEDVVEKLSAALVAAVNEPEVQAWAEETGNPMPALDAAATNEAVMDSLDYHKSFGDVIE